MASNSAPPLINRVLPPEMLEKIFSHLSHEDLNTAMLVCKTWNRAGEAPSLWSWITIKNVAQLPLKRLQACQEVAVGDPWLRIPHPKKPEYGEIASISWNRLLQEILQHPGLKKLTLYDPHTYNTWDTFSVLTGLDLGLFTQVLAKMGEIDIHWLGRSTLSRAAVGSVMNSLADSVLDGPSNLKRLVFRDVNYNGNDVDSVRFATALNKIETLEVKLSIDIVNLLLKAMMEEDTSVSSLSLLGNQDLSQLEPEHLFGVFDKLKEIGAFAYASPPQPHLVKTLFEKVAAGTNLKTLHYAVSHVNRDFGNSQK